MLTEIYLALLSILQNLKIQYEEFRKRNQAMLTLIFKVFTIPDSNIHRQKVKIDVEL